MVVTINRFSLAKFKYVASASKRSAGLFYLAADKFNFAQPGPLIAVSIDWSEPDGAYCVTEHNPFTYRDERYALIVDFTQARIWGLYCAEQRGALLLRGIRTLDGGPADASAKAVYFEPKNRRFKAAAPVGH